MLYMKVFKRVNHEFSSQGKNILFFFFYIVSIYIWDDRRSLNLLWQSFHDVCESNHYAVHLKLICYRSITSQ